MVHNFFEENPKHVASGKELVKRLFLYSGVEYVDDFKIKRCLNEIGRYIATVDPKLLPQEEQDRQVEEPRRNYSYAEKAKAVTTDMKAIRERLEKTLLSPTEDIDSFFLRYKERFKLDDKSFGLPRSKGWRGSEFVYNRCLFSRYAYSNGYKPRDISKVFNMERTSAYHYIFDCKIPE